MGLAQSESPSTATADDGPEAMIPAGRCRGYQPPGSDVSMPSTYAPDDWRVDIDAFLTGVRVSHPDFTWSGAAGVGVGFLFVPSCRESSFVSRLDTSIGGDANGDARSDWLRLSALGAVSFWLDPNDLAMRLEWGALLAVGGRFLAAPHGALDVSVGPLIRFVLTGANPSPTSTTNVHGGLDLALPVTIRDPSNGNLSVGFSASLFVGFGLGLL